MSAHAGDPRVRDVVDGVRAAGVFGQRVVVVVRQAGGEMEGKAADHPYRITPVVQIVAAEIEADDVGLAEMRDPGGKGAEGDLEPARRGVSRTARVV